MTHQCRSKDKPLTFAMVAVFIGLITIALYCMRQTPVELVDSELVKEVNEVELPVGALELVDGPVNLDANITTAKQSVPPSQLIEQMTKPIDGNPYLSTRKSIVSLDGFDEPMLRQNSS